MGLEQVTNVTRKENHNKKGGGRKWNTEKELFLRCFSWHHITLGNNNVDYKLYFIACVLMQKGNSERSRSRTPAFSQVLV